jgi:hypothetical protein
VALTMQWCWLGAAAQTETAMTASCRQIIRRSGARLLIAFAGFLVGATHSAPAASAPSAFEPRMVVQGTPLVLQGMGTRYRAVFKVYEMALYLPSKARSVDEILAANGPARLSFVALRELPGTDLGLTFIKGLTSNATAEQVRRHTPASARLVEIFSGRSKLSPGDTFAMEFMPGKGTTFYIQGEPQGAPVGDAEYFGMILRIWLGGSPVDVRLRDALVGIGAPGEAGRPVP